jgi:hypothetical protein
MVNIRTAASDDKTTMQRPLPDKLGKVALMSFSSSATGLAKA